ncbi:MAG TPA: cobalt transporter CbiM [Acidimicrobiia bacterium]|nr:cobalt transporter CbiM [Acidimicrobiia bacterium]
MHIPDGYLSPSTCAVFYGASVPVWVTAGRRVKKVVKSRYVPLVAIGAAYSFLVMMFNVPIPDGTTAHAVGAVLIAVLLGPWAAVIAVSIALLIQALFFGDGGVLAYGANVFNMAVVMPFVGYGVYRALVHRNHALTSPRRPLGAAVGAYVGLNVAALCTAVEFGLQPELFHTANGTPLYAPFHLSQTIPAMAFAHLVVAGVVEAVLTAGVITYLQKANRPVLQINQEMTPDWEIEEAPRRLGWRWALIGLGVMAGLTPLGLIAPGGAFGESAPADLDLGRYHLDAVPSGLRHYAGFWHNALFNGYDFSKDKHPAVGYLVSAVVGMLVIALVVAVVFKLVGRALRRRESEPAATVVDVRARSGARPSSATPRWLLEAEVGLCPCGCIGKRRKGSFVEKTLNGGAGVLRQAMFSDDTAARPGLLQRIDPRVKLASLLGLLITAALVRNIPVLVAMYAATLGLAAASRLPVGFFVRRVWLFIPIFTGVVVLPATFSFVTHGHIVVPLGSWFGHRVGLTSQGLHSAGLMVIRVATSISLVVLLTLTTPWTKLLAALRSLFVPRMFILVLGMAYRYLFHLLGSVTDMYTARKARMVGAETDVASGRAFVAAGAGALFGKAQALSEEVHMAMVARGYTGDVRGLSRFRLRAVDGAWSLACLLAAVLVIGGDHALGR